jgi:hypothetical protein
MHKRTSCEGGCHCGAVRFTIRIPLQLQVRRCNCSICTASGYQHLTVAHEDFTLLRGADSLSEYRFNTAQARHLFCKHCGIKSFYQPRSHPHAWSVNLACVELPVGAQVAISEFDGRNWELNVDEIRDVVN